MRLASRTANPFARFVGDSPNRGGIWYNVRMSEVRPESPEVLKFIAFCIEQYKCRHGGDGESVYSLFDRCGVLRFLSVNFSIEHCLDPEQIVDDIDQIIDRTRKGAHQ